MTGTDEIVTMTATDMAALVKSRDLSPVEIVTAVLAQIDRLDPVINAFCLVLEEQARTEAAEVERAAARGEDLGPLAGVPYSLKDLTSTAGIRTTFGSRLFEFNVPSVDAVIAERLRDAGGILLGKTNTPDHGCKAVTDNSMFGPTANPWALDRTPGGSSGGAAAAVSAGMGPLGEGSDFAGSIRIPAAHCGVVGFKPSDGLIPNYPDPMPLHPVAFNHGPLARSVSDAALMLDVMAGPDERDPRTAARPARSFVAALREPVASDDLIIGWLGNLGFAPLDDDVEDIAGQAARCFENDGARVETASADFAEAADAYSLLNANRRAATLESELEHRRDDMDPLLVRRIEMAVSRTAADAARAEVVQTRVYHRVRELFEQFDVLMLPTVPCAAFELGRDFPPMIGDRQISSPFDIIPLTFVFNLTGHPAVSLPAGWTRDGLPVGLQIVGPWRGDAFLLRVAAKFEQIAPWAHRWPPGVLSG